MSEFPTPFFILREVEAWLLLVWKQDEYICAARRWIMYSWPLFCFITYID